CQVRQPSRLPGIVPQALTRAARRPSASLSRAIRHQGLFRNRIRRQILQLTGFLGGVSGMPELRAVARAACLVLTVACAACTTASSRAPAAARGPGSGSAVIMVGSFDFPEGVLLAYLYAAGVAGKGYAVR